MKKHPHSLIQELVRSVPIALGLVLVWRGVWYLLDMLDVYFLGGTHFITALIGIVIGILLLYLPDRRLQEIERL